MASNINEMNINGSYPIAGQDNDSQGFRDNFTNIRSNLKYAKEEIVELQNKAILKEGITNSTGLSNDLTGVALRGATTVGFTTVASILPPTTNVPSELTLVFSSADIFQFTSTGDIKIAALNWDPITTGQHAKMRLWLNITSAAHSVEFPASVTVGLSNITLGITSNRILTPVVGTYILEFGTIDGGATVYVSPIVLP